MRARLLGHELRLLARNGFLGAYLAVTLAYLLLLDALPRPWAEALLPVLVWGDPVYFGFFFLGASVCLDLAEGSFRALFAAPLRPADYVLSKAAALALPSAASAFGLALGLRGTDFRPLPLALAVLLGSATSGAFGMAFALVLGTINRFMIGSIGALLLFSLPLLRLGGLEGAASLLLRATPFDGILSLVLAALPAGPGGPAREGPLSLAAGAAVALAWALLLGRLALAPMVARARGD